MADLYRLIFKKMTINKVIVILSIAIIVISFIFISGCVSDTNWQQTQNTHTMITSAPPQTVSTIPTTIATTLFSQPTTPFPVFTESGSALTDANGTQLLSKAKAWSYAEKYLERRGLTNITSDEVTSHDPVFFKEMDNATELVWTFEIDRKSPSGFERGGIILINAYDGHVVGYAALT